MCVAVPNEEGSEVGINKAELTAFLENAQSVYVTGSSVGFAYGAKKPALKATLMSTNGRVESDIKCEPSKAAFSFSVDYRFMQEVMSKSSAEETTQLTIVPGRFAVLKGKNLYYVASLASDTQKAEDA
jgi:hypothetical protein